MAFLQYHNPRRYSGGGGINIDQHHSKMIIVLWILMSTSYGLQVNKCCLESQLLDASTLQCVTEKLPPQRMTNFLPSYMLNLTSKQTDLAQGLITTKLQPEQIKSGHMIQCKAYQLLDLTKPLEYLISTDGSLISMAGVFAPSQKLGEFCIETALLRSKLTYRSALICDPCQHNSQTCIKSCCSHLQTAQFAQDSGSYTCKNTPILTGRSLAAQTEFANLTLIATKPRVRSSIERGGALGGNGLCSVNDTKILVEDFELEGNKIVSSADIPPKYQIKDFCLAFGENDTLMAELCVSHEDSVQVALFTKTYPICCTASNVFLILTFVVYMLLPELRAPLFGKITMIFVFCLFLAYFSISIVSFGHWKFVNDRPVGMDYSPICRILGFMVQFTYLQAFFWMNILSFDIYKTFCKVKKFTKNTKIGGKQDEIRKLLFYTMYACGAPMLIIILSVVVEYQPSTYSGPRPEFGVHRCFFGNDLGSFVFFHLPLLVIQTANVVFFVLTSKQLYESWKFTRSQLKNETSSGNTAVSTIRICPRRQNANQNFKVILKLFVVMGITHFSELIGFTLSWIYGRDRVWRYFVFNDVINLLQGVFIFFVLVCKPSVLSQIWPLSFPDRKKISISQVTQVTISNGNSK